MENKFFCDALQNFMFEEAGGGAIRHLADRGYTAKQVAETLSFPIPYEKVREAYTEYLLAGSILLKERPDTYREPEKTEFVREYDKYGKATFRKVTISPKKESAGTFDAGRWLEKDFEEFLLLYRKRAGQIRLPGETDFAEQEKTIYIGCEFGPERAEQVLAALEGTAQEYVQGICWTRKKMYHLLNGRMLDIAVKLREKGIPVGAVYIHASLLPGNFGGEH